MTRVINNKLTSVEMSAVSDGDAIDGFLLSLPSSLSPIDHVPHLGLFDPVTIAPSSANDNSTWTVVGESLDHCSANTYAYEDFTQTEWVRAGFIVLYVVIVVLSVVGNFMVIWTIARNRHMRTVTNYYILNLAVADFLVALVVMPLKLIEYTAPCQWHVFSRHSALCPMLYYILPVFVFTSVLTLVAISVERYYAIVYPLSAMVVNSKSRTRKLIAITWLVPLVLASPYLYCHSYTFTIYSRHGVASREICADRFDDLGHFRRGFFLLLFVVVYLLPMAIIGVTCVRIAVTLHQPTTNENAAPIAQQRETNKRKVARMIMLIALAFWLCWTPFYSVAAVTQLQTYSFLRESQFLFTMLATHWAGFLNSCLNPLIYAALSNNFRRGFKQMLQCWCCCLRRTWHNSNRRQLFADCQVLDNNVVTPQADRRRVARQHHHHYQQQQQQTQRRKLAHYRHQPYECNEAVEMRCYHVTTGLS